MQHALPNQHAPLAKASMEWPIISTVPSVLLRVLQTNTDRSLDSSALIVQMNAQHALEVLTLNVILARFTTVSITTLSSELIFATALALTDSIATSLISHADLAA